MPPLDYSSVGRSRLRRAILGAVVGLILIGSLETRAQTLVQVPPNLPVLTNIYQIWDMAQAERALPHHIRTEISIYYLDPEWNVAWGESGGRPAYLHVTDSPIHFKVGQRVLLDGVLLPREERFLWDQTTVTVLEEGIKFKPTLVTNLADHAVDLQSHLVTVNGFIDRQMVDPTHVTLNFIAEGTPATTYILKGTNETSLPFAAGDLIRVTCIYAPRFDREGKLSDVNLWVPSLDDIQVTGSLEKDPRFAVPATPTAEISEITPTNTMLRVAGTVRNHEPGKWVTLWDGAGQVMVQSKQTLPLRIGDPVEAIGYAYVVGVQQYLHGGIYRIAKLDDKTNLTNTPGNPYLPLAARVRDLSREEAARHGSVKLRGVVTWSHTDTPFTYVQDASGGIRVVNPKWVGQDASKPGAIVMVEGQVDEGGFVPVVTNAVLTRVGWWNLEQGTPVTLEQALTGVEDGQWVQMSGYVRNVVAGKGLIRLDLSTTDGQFEVWTPASQSFEDYKGSIVRVQGVCAAVANARHQLTGIQIWAPRVNDFAIEESAPDDLFVAPLRSPANLRRFSSENSLNQRVRTFGTVVLQAPGRYLYVQDGADSVFALAEQTDLLHPGDRVEVVGFPGNEGRRFLLREAAYRRISAGPEPSAIQLPVVHSVNFGMEGLLARAEGTVLNILRKDGESRLLVRSGDSTFEASLDPAAGTAGTRELELEAGSQIAVTGVYEIQSDESGKARSYLLRLRSWNDVAVIARPPWWTLARLGWALLAVLAISVMAVIWGVLISRKNALLKQAQGALQTAHDKLELRVEERTHELREQVVAKERARAELAQAQERLILTSRQAGMAEVATGVLHNVGNVLNSVNVSAALLGERLRGCRVESVTKAAALLRQPPDQLAGFLVNDPKGQALPGYLEKLGDVLAQDKKDMQTEVESLTKNVDHIKVIVAMQQSYAKIGGVLEDLDPRDLAEDALQINSGSLERHGVQLVRDYQTTQRVMVDRHKVLQILVNLVTNAVHALKGHPGAKTLKLSLAPAGPGRVHLSVADNGVGIAPENLSQIFSQGFTTRRDGHGFGLHSGANAAKELGGSLSVESAGLGQGAIFTLELPIANGVHKHHVSADGNGNGHSLAE